MDFGLAVHLGDQRAGGIELEEVAATGLLGDRFGDPVAEKITGALVLSGISSSSFDKIAPFALRLSTT
jgi:hypothetical protein